MTTSEQLIQTINSLETRFKQTEQTLMNIAIEQGNALLKLMASNRRCFGKLFEGKVPIIMVSRRTASSRMIVARYFQVHPAELKHFTSYCQAVAFVTAKVRKEKKPRSPRLPVQSSFESPGQGTPKPKKVFVFGSDWNDGMRRMLAAFSNEKQFLAALPLLITRG